MFFKKGEVVRNSDECPFVFHPFEPLRKGEVIIRKKMIKKNPDGTLVALGDIKLGDSVSIEESIEEKIEDLEKRLTGLMDFLGLFDWASYVGRRENGELFRLKESIKELDNRTYQKMNLLAEVMGLEFRTVPAKPSSLELVQIPNRQKTT